jgi:predicted ribonuclease YlaK
MQRFAQECMVNDVVRIFYVVGKAGFGKTRFSLLAAETLQE